MGDEVSRQAEGHGAADGAAEPERPARKSLPKIIERAAYPPFLVITRDNDIDRIDIGDFKTFGDDVVERYQAEMDRYFKFERKLYPLRKDWPELGRRDFRFFRIHEAETERMFPSESDIRRYIDALRSRFAKTIVGFTIFKRAAFLLTLAAIAVCAELRPSFARFADPLTDQAVSLGAVIALILLVFVWIQREAYNRYYNSLLESSTSVGSLIVKRSNDLDRLLPNLKSAVESGDKGHISQGDRRWPAKAAFITRLIIWVAKRMEYMEKYLQPEMWRIGRMQTWCRIGGRIVLYASFAAALALEAVRLTLGGLPVLQGGLAIVGAVVAWAVSRKFNLAPGYVQNTLQKDVPTIASARMDDIIGEMVRNDKSYAMAMFHRDHSLPGESRDPGHG